MSAARFLIAKYVPDKARMEPHNVGVILWTPRRVAYRFVPEHEARFIGDESTYNRWLEFWSYTIDSDDLEIRGEHIPKGRKDYLDWFSKTQKGNYILDDSQGEMIDSIKVRDVQAVIDQLYDRLVSPSKSQSTQERRTNVLDDICDRIFDETGLSERSDFQERASYTIDVGNTQRELSVDYSIGNGRPSTIFQKSSIRSQMNVDAKAMTTELAVQYLKTRKSNCYLLVRADEADLSKRSLRSRIAFLNEYGTVVNVDRFDEAAKQIEKAAANGHH